MMAARVASEAETPAVTADESLVERLRAGDAAAGEELVRRYCDPLLRYLQRLLGSDQLAEEIHQQTWLSVLDNIDRFDPDATGGGFKAWAYRIATNKANDYWRSRGREKTMKETLRLVTDEAARRRQPPPRRRRATKQAPQGDRAVAGQPEGSAAVEVL